MISMQSQNNSQLPMKGITLTSTMPQCNQIPTIFDNRISPHGQTDIFASNGTNDIPKNPFHQNKNRFQGLNRCRSLTPTIIQNGTQFSQTQQQQAQLQQTFQGHAPLQSHYVNGIQNPCQVQPNQQYYYQPVQQQVQINFANIQQQQIQSPRSQQAPINLQASLKTQIQVPNQHMIQQPQQLTQSKSPQPRQQAQQHQINQQTTQQQQQLPTKPMIFAQNVQVKQPVTQNKPNLVAAVSLVNPPSSTAQQSQIEAQLCQSNGQNQQKILHNINEESNYTNQQVQLTEKDNNEIEKIMQSQYYLGQKGQQQSNIIQQELTDQSLNLNQYTAKSGLILNTNLNLSEIPNNESFNNIIGAKKSLAPFVEQFNGEISKHLFVKDKFCNNTMQTEEYQSVIQEEGITEVTKNMTQLEKQQAINAATNQKPTMLMHENIPIISKKPYFDSEFQDNKSQMIENIIFNDKEMNQNVPQASVSYAKEIIFNPSNIDAFKKAVKPLSPPESKQLIKPNNVLNIIQQQPQKNLIQPIQEIESSRGSEIQLPQYIYNTPKNKNKEVEGNNDMKCTPSRTLEFVGNSQQERINIITTAKGNDKFLVQVKENDFIQQEIGILAQQIIQQEKDNKQLNIKNKPSIYQQKQNSEVNKEEYKAPIQVNVGEAKINRQSLKKDNQQNNQMPTLQFNPAGQQKQPLLSTSDNEIECVMGYQQQSNTKLQNFEQEIFIKDEGGYSEINQQQKDVQAIETIGQQNNANIQQVQAPQEKLSYNNGISENEQDNLKMNYEDQVELGMDKNDNQRKQTADFQYNDSIDNDKSLPKESFEIQTLDTKSNYQFNNSLLTDFKQINNNTQPLLQQINKELFQQEDNSYNETSQPPINGKIKINKIALDFPNMDMLQCNLYKDNHKQYPRTDRYQSEDLTNHESHTFSNRNSTVKVEQNQPYNQNSYQPQLNNNEKQQNLPNILNPINQERQRSFSNQQVQLNATQEKALAPPGCDLLAAKQKNLLAAYSSKGQFEDDELLKASSLSSHIDQGANEKNEVDKILDEIKKKSGNKSNQSNESITQPEKAANINNNNQIATDRVEKIIVNIFNNALSNIESKIQFPNARLSQKGSSENLNINQIPPQSNDNAKKQSIIEQQQQLTVLQQAQYQQKQDNQKNDTKIINQEQTTEPQQMINQEINSNINYKNQQTSNLDVQEDLQQQLLLSVNHNQKESIKETQTPQFQKFNMNKSSEQFQLQGRQNDSFSENLFNERVELLEEIPNCQVPTPQEQSAFRPYWQNLQQTANNKDIYTVDEENNSHPNQQSNQSLKNGSQIIVNESSQNSGYNNYQEIKNSEYDVTFEYRQFLENMLKTCQDEEKSIENIQKVSSFGGNQTFSNSFMSLSNQKCQEEKNVGQRLKEDEQLRTLKKQTKEKMKEKIQEEQLSQLVNQSIQQQKKMSKSDTETLIDKLTKDAERRQKAQQYIEQQKKFFEEQKDSQLNVSYKSCTPKANSSNQKGLFKKHNKELSINIKSPTQQYQQKRSVTPKSFAKPNLSSINSNEFQSTQLQSLETPQNNNQFAQTQPFKPGNYFCNSAFQTPDCLSPGNDDRQQENIQDNDNDKQKEQSQCQYKVSNIDDMINYAKYMRNNNRKLLNEMLSKSTLVSPQKNDKSQTKSDQKQAQVQQDKSKNQKQNQNKQEEKSKTPLKDRKQNNKSISQVSSPNKPLVGKTNDQKQLNNQQAISSKKKQNVGNTSINTSQMQTNNGVNGNKKQQQVSGQTPINKKNKVPIAQQESGNKIKNNVDSKKKDMQKLFAHLNQLPKLYCNNLSQEPENNEEDPNNYQTDQQLIQFN